MDKDCADDILNKTRQDYNFIAEAFSSKRQFPWEETRFLFDDYLTAGARVLDLGCGNGRFYEFVKDKTADYWGVDFSDKLIAMAQNKYPTGRFQVADAMSLSFPNDYFDNIYSIAVLHHIPSGASRLWFLREARRTLKTNGKLILTVWKFNRLRHWLRLAKYSVLKLLGLSRLDFGDFYEPWDRKTQRYYHYFSRSGLKKLVSEAGFKVEKIGILKNARGNRQNMYVVAKK